MMAALILLSGGQDSTTCLFWAVRRYGRKNVHAIGFDYGQRHVDELNYAKRVCDDFGIPFVVVPLPAVSALTENALTRGDIPVDGATVTGPTPPNTLVEGRNLLFLTYAAIYAKTHGIRVLVTGVSQSDFSGYPDCRDVFIKSANATLALCMDYDFEIRTPLMWRDKAQVWALADELGVLDIIRSKTLTCYNGTAGDGCGDCPACALRRRGYDAFMSLGDKDV
jgi:7-cyano-7-deazaguanine synthase